MYHLFVTLLAILVIGETLADTNLFGLTNGKIRWSDGKLFFPDLSKATSRPNSDQFKQNMDPFRSQWNFRPTWGPERPTWVTERSVWGPERPSWGPEAENYIEPKDMCILTSTPPDPKSQCCGVDATSNNRIVGGKPSQIEQFPWLVQIEYHDKNQNVFKRMCGGFLISGRYVLSAAHCFSGDILNIGRPVNVILGEYNTTNEGPDSVNTTSGATACTDGVIKVPIEKYRVHTKYLFDRVTNLNDIAIVRLNHTVKYTKYIRPLCLPTTDIAASPPPKLRFYTAGWGAIEHQIIKERRMKFVKMEFDDIKRHVDLPFVENKKCREQFRFLTNGHLCAGGERNKDTCKGDSGGPLMYKKNGVFEASGIVSTASGKYACGTEDRLGVYTNVYRYIDWIKDNIKP